MSRTLVQDQSDSLCLVSYAGRCKFRRIHRRGRTNRSAVRASGEPLEGIMTSPNGFLSEKDGGSMFYVIRVA